ncbi:sugar kinase [Ornithinimicrobium cavernae]|uniref:sugar kinase n=1 Tax=Ornithinimicrobium cavernae TaxID=2666047 RepID=UPI0023519A99|nr:sugar kinase [Ornithinimicrobium cavernae]
MEVTTIGEGQLRLTAGPGKALASADALEVYVAGTEANVVGLLSRLGHRTAMVSALPDSPLSRRILEELGAAGIDTSGIVTLPGRVALYFVEENVSPLPSQVHYDRQHSAFASIRPEDVDWSLVSSSRLLHLTGITAALTDHTRAVLEAALERARAVGQRVSFDINHRTRLWDAETARRWFDDNLPGRVTVVTCARRDAEAVFGLTGAAPEVARHLADRLGARTVLVSDGNRPVHCWHGGDVLSRAPLTVPVVDRVGAGDALVGGFLHGYLTGDIEEGLAAGVAAASLTLTRRGEQLRTTGAELARLAARADDGQTEDIER